MCSVTDESDEAMSVSAEEARESAGNTTNTCCPALSQIYSTSYIPDYIVSFAEFAVCPFDYLLLTVCILPQGIKSETLLICWPSSEEDEMYNNWLVSHKTQYLV